MGTSTPSGACMPRERDSVEGVVVSRLCLLFSALVLTACFVEPLDDTTVVRLRLDLGEIEQPLEDLPGVRSADGLVHLDEVPAFVWVEVMGPGMETPLLAAWPEDGALSPREEVVLELEVPAGPERSFSILAYVYRAGVVRVWTDDGTMTRDLEGGSSTDLDVALPELATVALQCELTGLGREQVVAVVVVDGDPVRGSEAGPGLALPGVAVADGQAELSGIPSGRPVTFQLIMADGLTQTSPSGPLTFAADDSPAHCQIEALLSLQ